MATSTDKTVRGIGWFATTLVIIGALNWALIGLFNFNLVKALFGGLPIIERAIYVVVGLAGLYLIFFTRALSHGARFGETREPATVMR